MLIDLTPEQYALRDTLRSYFAGLLSPEQRVTLLTERHGRVYREVVRTMGRDGWLGVGWPTAYGGRGFGQIEQQIFVNEAARADIPLPAVTLQTVGPVLQEHGTRWQRDFFLPPILAGEIHFAIGYTEPEAGTDLAALRTSAVLDGDEYVVSGRKWWSSGAMRPECTFAIVMGVSDPDAERHARHSMILVPLDAPGVTLERSTSVFGYNDGPHGGHALIHYDDVRVPAANLLGPQGGGFMMAQARLGPGRIHHCMRSLGAAERALELMCARASSRSTFGSTIARHGVVQEWIAESRLAIEQARLLVLKAAWLIDNVGAKGAKTEIAAIKVAAPRAASYVLDRAIQVHGGAGVSADTPLAESWAHLRTLHLADGPDEVHLRSIAREELRPYR